MYQKRDNRAAILSLYTGDYGRELYLREIGRLARIPVKTAQDALFSLMKQKVLKSEARGKHRYFRLNLESIRTKLHLLRAETHKTLEFLNRHPGFEMFLKEMAADIPLVVFGSFAEGREKGDSDVDLLVLSGREVELPAHCLPNSLHAVRLGEAEFRRGLGGKEALIEEIRERHVILEGHSSFVNALWDLYA